MACQSLSTTTWKTKTRCQNSASKISCYFHKPSSMFHFFATIPNGQHNKLHPFIACSLGPSSSQTPTSSSSCNSTRSASSSSSCSTSYAATFRHTTSKKSAENERKHDLSFSVVHVDDSSILKQMIKKAKAQNPLKVGLKSLARKRPLWLKFWFSSKKIRSIIMLNVITVIFASNIPVVKDVETSMDAATFSAVRFVVSAIPFLPFVFHAQDDIKTRNAGMELGLWVSLGYLIEAVGLLTADAGRASFISLFTVIVVPLLDGLLGAIVPTRTWFGILMSSVGIAMLECSGSPPSVGDLLNFLSAIFFGIHMLRTEHISRNTKKENFLALLGYEVCVVALLSTIWVLIGGWYDGVNGYNQSSWTWTELWDSIVAFPWIAALYTGVFSTGLCLWVEIAAMRDVSATETAIIYGLEPLWGAGFAWFLLGERWGTIGWIGAALVLGGSLMVQILGSLPPNEANETEQATRKGDLLLVSEKQKLQNGLSTSPVIVRKDEMDMFK
ncbi:hypothetical protein F2P56_013249 [Juglans regia]|uniref:Uncharacterized protein LOC108986187 n=2 Tax=Juglans regia TaxID=51240 RepID=A0A2I4E4D4_JUGRE|nr:uncharacterized protein LOC108986187 [Juglans regia]XP_018814262.2 uncharacterized protein LOC108986187 [Juglans regia]KAF5469155.1 hypothetical protein F2P56_013249 [Juglans regia]